MSRGHRYSNTCKMNSFILEFTPVTAALFAPQLLPPKLQWQKLTDVSKECKVQTVWKNKNLQLYFGGQVISLIGTWMQQMALSWLVYRLTNSPFMLGVIACTSQLPSLLLTPVAGIIADRANRHHLILLTQTLAMLQAACLAALVCTGKAQLWQLVALSCVLGIITAFDMPARQSFLVDMLENNDHLASAIGINSSINTLTRLVGPFIAGLFVSWAGEGICFSINAVSYIAVIAALLFVKPRAFAPNLTPKTSLEQLKEGFVYTFGFAPIRDLILFISLVGLFTMPFAILMPAFAKDIFHGDAMTLGILNGAAGAGSVAGALFLMSRKGAKQLSRWVIIGCVMCGIGLCILGSSTLLPLSLLAVALVGFGSMMMLAGSNTMIQTIVDPDKRGRVMSFVVMAFLGLGPFGCMMAGTLANKIGLGITIVITGVTTLVLAIAFRSRVMQIYLKVPAKPPTKETPIELEQAIREADEEIAIMTGT